MASKRTSQIRALLKGIETGDLTAVAGVNPNNYIRHNAQTSEGGAYPRCLSACLRVLRASTSCVPSNMATAFSLTWSTTSLVLGSASKFSDLKMTRPLRTGTAFDSGKAQILPVIRWSMGRPKRPESPERTQIDKSFGPWLMTF
jgi:hypothetical protein